ncbi:MAG TPA: VWA domain-containing protein [Polyangiaceae bacterium]|nr:VWA domain-containing protein [Polyangiaceae bacterium]
MADPKESELLERWRLVLGAPAGQAMPNLSPRGQAMDAALEWLYGRDPELAERGVQRTGGSGESQLTTPDWVNEVHRLFPKETIERLERDAVERFGIDEVVTNLEVLERIEPSESLLRAVLHTKHLMNPEVLAKARALVAKVVEELMRRLSKEVRASFSGVRDRRRPSLHKSAKNFDLRRTIQTNLKHYQPELQRIALEKPRFFSRTRRFTERWQIILVVDQSGSMVGSVIHSAVTAACLWGLPGMRTHLVAFDTQVVDLTADVADPVDLLMKVQLGGGTDIAKAVEYAASLIEAPRRAIVVLISDFYEGGDAHRLVRATSALCEQGSKVLGLAALDPDANPVYDRALAQELVNVGASVGAMTPGALASWIAEQVQR